MTPHVGSLRVRSFLLVCSSAAIATSAAISQCGTQWLPGDPVAGANGRVYAMVRWDRDGAGPLPPVVVIGGRFTAAGSAGDWSLATYEPVSRTWGTLGSVVTLSGGSSFGADVRALAVAPNGDLLVGGQFNSIDGVPVNNVARFDGIAWSPLGAGVEGPSVSSTWVSALTVRPGGDVIAAGYFTTAGGLPASGLARWDGAAWSTIGAPSFIPQTAALATMPNGDVVLGGDFTTIGGVAANNIARWNGTTWSPLGTGLNGGAQALLLLSNGDLIVGGSFVVAGGQTTGAIARWNGATWSPLGTGMPNPVRALAVLTNGDIVAGGQFASAGGVLASRIARFDGVAWSPLGAGIAGPNCELQSVFALANGELLAGGLFESAGGVPVLNLARWDGASWAAPAAGTYFVGGVFPGVHAIARLANGDLVVAGSFATVGGVPASNVARRTGNTWVPLGAGLSGQGNTILELPNGDIVVGGCASSFSGGRVSRWNGSTWTSLGPDFAVNPSSVTGIAAIELLNGEIVACGDFPGRVARWDGASWQLLGGGLPTSVNNYASAMKALPNGDLLVSAMVTVNGTNYAYARWDGVAWTPLPSFAPTAGTFSFAILANGDVIAGGINGFYPVERLSGNQWVPYAPAENGNNKALLPLPNGDFVAVRDRLSTSELRRWNGTAWVSFAAPLGGGASTALVLPDGDVLVGGSFAAAGGLVSAGFARLVPTCRALAAPFGTGCSGSGGANVLAATSLPWRGATFSAIATGMPVNGLALAVTGFAAAALPLSSILPQGGAGCFLLATPDVVLGALPAGGSVTTALAIPNSASLIGQVFHHQVVAVDFAPSGAITALTSTNRLTALIGSL